MTEAEAKVRLEKVDIYEANFRPMKATLSGSGERAIMKLIVDGEDARRCVGAHILAEDAGEMIQLVAVAMTHGRDQGRLRRHHGRASDRGRGTGDDAHAFAPLRRRRVDGVKGLARAGPWEERSCSGGYRRI